MKYIEYLPWPRIPESLIPSLTDTIESPSTKGTRTSRLLLNDVFVFKRPSPELEAWVQLLFPYNIIIRFQLIKTEVKVHIDHARKIAYNYVIDPGGPNVSTAVYSSDMELLQSEIIQPHRWHKLEVSYLHGIHNIDPSLIRRVLSITPESALLEGRPNINGEVI